MRLKSFLGLILAGLCTSFAWGDSFSAKILNERGLARATSAQVDTNAANVSKLSYQATYSSANFTAASFTDGRLSTATITLSATGYSVLSSAPAVNTIVIASNTALAGTTSFNTISVASNTYLLTTGDRVYLELHGTTITLNQDWFAAVTASQTATNLATAINAAGVYGITASTSSTGSSVTLSAAVFGVAWNSYTLASSSPAALTAGNATFVGGADRASFTLNGYKLTANRQFTVDMQSIMNTAISIARAISFSSYSVTAATSTIGTSTAVVITARENGKFGNSYTLTSSTVALGVSSTTFVSGRDAAVFKFNDIPFVNGVEWNSGTTSSGTAKAISDALMANPAIRPLLITTWTVNSVSVSSIGIVWATSTLVNHNDYVFFSSSQTAMILSSPTTSSDGSAIGYFTNGSTSNIVLSSGTGASFSTNTYIVAPNTFTVALAVLFSSAAGTAPNPLFNQTTYFVTNPTPNTFQLAFTATGAAAGNTIGITTFTQTGGGNFSVSPVPFSGTGGFKWTMSNDGQNWTNMNVSSITISATSGSTTTVVDMGSFNARYARIEISTPNTGGINLSVDVNGKQ